MNNNTNRKAKSNEKIVKSNRNIFVNSCGQIVDNRNDCNDECFELNNVYKCLTSNSDSFESIDSIIVERFQSITTNEQFNLDGDVDYRLNNGINSLENDENLKKFKRMLADGGGATYLVTDSKQLFGVIITTHHHHDHDDDKDNDTNKIIYGPIKMILPQPNSMHKNNVVILRHRDNKNIELQSTKYLNLNEIIQNNNNNNDNDKEKNSNNNTVGIVSINGYLLISMKNFTTKINRLNDDNNNNRNNNNQMEFILVLNGGYILTENIEINWIRPSSSSSSFDHVNDGRIQPLNDDDDTSCHKKCTIINKNDVWVCKNAGLIIEKYSTTTMTNDNKHNDDGGDNIRNDRQQQQPRQQQPRICMRLIDKNAAIIDYTAFKHACLSLKYKKIFKH